MASVLCTGADSVLLETRKLILEQAGHTVISATHQDEVIAACKAGKIDVAVIGQSISSNNKRLVSSLVRQHCPGAKVLELYRPTEGRIIPDADSWLEVPALVPQDLAIWVERLAEETRNHGDKLRSLSETPTNRNL